MSETYNLLTECSTVRVWAEPHNLKCQEWKNDVMQYPKLRTYVTFDVTFCIEPYTSVNMNQQYRSVLAQVRCGIMYVECGV